MTYNKYNNFSFDVISKYEDGYKYNAACISLDNMFSKTIVKKKKKY